METVKVVKCVERVENMKGGKKVGEKWRIDNLTCAKIVPRKTEANDVNVEIVPRKTEASDVKVDSEVVEFNFRQGSMMRL